ncbi:unnamed protein product, partial [Coregonus sp. 'balchen']
DYCEINVCSNGGTCVTGAGAPFICICPDGYTGDTCNDTEAGDVFSEYICKCQDGFDGVHCQN